MALSGTVRALIQMTHTEVHDANTGQTTAGGIDTGQFSTVPQTIFTDGTGSGQADKMFSDSRTIATSANDDIDLAGSLTDEFGAALTFVKIKTILIHNTGSTAIIQIDQSVTNGWVAHWSNTSQIIIPAGGWLLVHSAGSAGLGTVTAGTGDLLRITNNDGSNVAAYNIVIIGTS